MSRSRVGPPTSARFSRRTFMGGALGLGAAGTLAACSTAGPVVDIDTSGGPITGGTLRVGLTGGSSADSLDAHIPVNSGDTARVINLYEPLIRRGDDYSLEYRLAESMEADESATRWTVTLRENLKFSDGSQLTADDVAFTIDRIRDPEDPKNGSAMLVAIEELEVKDDRTLIIHLSAPDAELDDAFSQYQMGIVPRGYDPDNPIGAGPFKVGSFTASQSTSLVRNDHYWEGPAHLDEVELINFNDDDAMLNALLSTQVDAIGQIPPALARVIEADERLAILDSETGMWLPFTMRVDAEPFDDVRVRQAFRLAVDREEMVRQVFSGHGQVGNDMFGLYDDHYPQFTQREQDVEKAKKLLADAGYPDGITVELVTAPIQAGAVEATQVFAQQAKQAGITINLRRLDTSTFFGDDYLQWPFAQSFWYTRDILSQINQCAMDASPFNETHWGDQAYTDLFHEAQAETDDAKRGKLKEELQKRLFDEGGYIIWGFSNQVDAYQRYVVGFEENATGSPLGGYNFHRVWIAEVGS